MLRLYCPIFLDDVIRHECSLCFSSVRDWACGLYRHNGIWWVLLIVTCEYLKPGAFFVGSFKETRLLLCKLEQNETQVLAKYFAAANKRFLLVVTPQIEMLCLQHHPLTTFGTKGNYFCRFVSGGEKRSTFWPGAPNSGEAQKGGKRLVLPRKHGRGHQQVQKSECFRPASFNLVFAFLQWDLAILNKSSFQPFCLLLIRNRHAHPRKRRKFFMLLVGSFSLEWQCSMFAFTLTFPIDRLSFVRLFITCKTVGWRTKKKRAFRRSCCSRRRWILRWATWRCVVQKMNKLSSKLFYKDWKKS